MESEIFVGFLEEVVRSENRDLWVAILAPNGLVLVKAKNADREYRLKAFIMSTEMPFTYIAGRRA